jgi:acetyl esterase/lipase
MPLRSLLAGTAAALLLLAPTAGAQSAPRVACSDDADAALRLDLPVRAGDTGAVEDAFGYYALPEGAPRGIVVFAHGHGNSAWKWQTNVRNAARDLGVIAVAMDYRRQTFPKSAPGTVDITTESYGWRVREGAEDSIAAAQLFERACGRTKKKKAAKQRRRLPVVMYGVSMGGNASGLAVATGAKRADGSPLFDYWFDIEGVANVIETYLEARAVAGPPLNNKTGQIAVAEIEEEMGGTLEERAETYLDHTVVSRVDDIKASGLKGVVMVHGIDDGTVPFNQSPELFSRLVEQRIPTDFFSVARRGSGSDGQTLEETLTIAGYIPGYSPLFAGHGGENDLTHPVIEVGFDRLERLLNDGRRPTCFRAFVVDEGRYSSDPEATELPDC